MSHHIEAGSTQSSRRTPRWIATAWTAVMVVIAAHHLPKAWASHSYTGSTQSHLASVHWNDGTSTSAGSQDEEYCIQSYTANVDGTRMAGFIEETLAKLSSTYIWDGTANWRVDFWRKSSFCLQYDTATRNTIESEFRIADSWTECGAGYSCVLKFGPVTDPVNGHTHYKYANAQFVASHVWGYDTRARKFINHETGHILGLADPGSTGCMESVMHNDLYGCPSTIWYPSSSDKGSVTKVADRTN